MRASSVDKAILEVLSTENTHLSSHEVYEQILIRLPAVNPSTVYRSLERLTNNGLISISDMGTGAEVYEAVKDEIHHHLVCRKCGRITTLKDEDVRRFFVSIEEANQFKITTNHLVLFGYCAGCLDELKNTAQT
jgi:Fur family ferric uptake transcriptional regulator